TTLPTTEGRTCCPVITAGEPGSTRVLFVYTLSGGNALVHGPHESPGRMAGDAQAAAVPRTALADADVPAGRGVARARTPGRHAGRQAAAGRQAVRRLPRLRASRHGRQARGPAT